MLIDVFEQTEHYCEVLSIQTYPRIHEADKVDLTSWSKV